MTHIYSIKIISWWIYLPLGLLFLLLLFFIEKLEMDDQWQNGKKTSGFF